MFGGLGMTVAPSLSYGTPGGGTGPCPGGAVDWPGGVVGRFTGSSSATGSVSGGDVALGASETLVLVGVGAVVSGSSST
jgi:hypothetical protein